MPYYRICPECGGSLDPGERCDCHNKEKTAPVRQHRSGLKVKVIDQTTFTSDFNKRMEEMQV